MPNPWIPSELFGEYMKKRFPPSKPLSYRGRLLSQWHNFTFRVQEAWRTLWDKPSNNPWDD